MKSSPAYRLLGAALATVLGSSSWCPAGRPAEFDGATPLQWSVRMADSETSRLGDKLAWRPGRTCKWDYTAGLFTLSLLKLNACVPTPAYVAFAKDAIGSFIGEDGSIQGYQAADYNLDNIAPGKTVIALYEITREPRYKRCADLLRKQLQTQPRTSQGGFWHKQRYPSQMWLDGLFMAAPFYAEYTLDFNGPASDLDDVVKQFRLIDEHLYEPNSGLYRHGWDEKRQQEWADKTTGQSASLWGRAVGWWIMAQVDVLDFLPKDHPGRAEIIALIKKTSAGIVKHQDPSSGLWWQVLDKGGKQGNYLEATASAMFVAALAKAVNHGYLPQDDIPAILKGYEGILHQFIKTDGSGNLSLTRCCAVAGLGYGRNGSYEYYLREPIVDNDLKGVGPFILAGIELQQLLGLPMNGRSAQGAGEPSTAISTRRAPSAVVAALDGNGDGTIDANELEQAARALGTLDQNRDGKLTRDEFRPLNLPATATAAGSAAPRPAAVASAPAPLVRRPNVLVIVADDLGWNGVGFHDKTAPTPCLNHLAGEAMELGRFYTYPVCSPTRAAFLTGMFPRRFGIVDALGPRQAGLPANTATLPETLRGAGYQTSLIGKWHLGESRLPMQSGFEHFYGHLGPQIDYFKHTNPRGDPDWQRDGKQLAETGYSTDLLADEAIRQINQRDKQRPFFIEVAFNAPHVPLSAPAALVAKHQSGGGVYAAVIEAMDTNIGRILTALDGQGLRDDTLVVFYSDNGAGRRFSSNAPFSQGKDSINEGGIHTPCLVRWPGKIQAGTNNQHPVAVQDLFPSLAAACQIKLGSPLDGSNQWPAILAGKPANREPILIASHDLALLAGDWKLIESESGQQALYNLSRDPSETRDELATQPDLAKQLAATLATLKKDLPAVAERRTPPDRN